MPSAMYYTSHPTYVIEMDDFLDVDVKNELGILNIPPNLSGWLSNSVQILIVGVGRVKGDRRVKWTAIGTPHDVLETRHCSLECVANSLRLVCWEPIENRISNR